MTSGYFKNATGYVVDGVQTPVSAATPLPVAVVSGGGGGGGGIVASDGVTLPIDSLAQTLAYTGSDLTSISVSYGGSTYIQTLTYTGDKLTGVSVWVKQ